MNSADKFLHELEDSPVVMRLREIRDVISTNKKYLEAYQRFLEFQRLVIGNSEENGGSIQTSDRILWQERLDLLQSDPLIQEYLDLIACLNVLIQNVSSTITKMMDFEL